MQNDLEEIIKKLIFYSNDYDDLPDFLAHKKNRKNLWKLHFIISDLLLWQKTLFKENSTDVPCISNCNQYYMQDYEITDYKNVIEDSEELSLIFIIKNDIIQLNPSLTSLQIIEIRQLIEKLMATSFRVKNLEKIMK